MTVALAPLALPATAKAWPQWLEDRTRTSIETAQELIATLKDGTRRTAVEVLDLWNLTDIALRAADSVTSLFAEVHPDLALREQAEGHQQELAKIQTERTQDRDLFSVVNATDPTGLDHDATRFETVATHHLTLIVQEKTAPEWSRP